MGTGSAALLAIELVVAHSVLGHQVTPVEVILTHQICGRNKQVKVRHYFTYISSSRCNFASIIFHVESVTICNMFYKKLYNF